MSIEKMLYMYGQKYYSSSLRNLHFVNNYDKFICRQNTTCTYLGQQLESFLLNINENGHIQFSS